MSAPTLDLARLAHAGTVEFIASRFVEAARKHAG